MWFTFVKISSMRKRKKIKVSSPPSENRRRVFKQPFTELAGTSPLRQDHSWWSSSIDLILLLLLVVKVVSKPCKALTGVRKGRKGRRSEEWLSDG